jgi:zinc protease
MKPLVEKYIGGLSSSNRKEHAYDHGVRPPNGEVVKHFTREMKEPKGYSYIQYSSYLPYNVTNKFRIGAIQYIIRRRCVDQVREEAGGTYGVRVRAHINDFPMGKAHFVANYNCDPERVHDLNKIIYSIIEDFKTNGPTDEEIQVTKEYYLKKKQENLKNNSYIMYLINNYLKEGYNPADEIYYEDQIELITKESLQEMANNLFTTNLIEIVMVPPEEQK